MPTMNAVEQEAEALHALIRRASLGRDIDALAHKLADAKIALLQRRGKYDLYAAFSPADSLVHGDFHNENLIFTEHKRLPSILDFDLAYLGNGIADVFNFMLFACFNTGFARHNFSKGSCFLEAYTERRRTTTTELEFGTQCLLDKLAGSFFLEATLYNTRDLFFAELLERDLKKVLYLKDNLPEFTNLLVGRASGHTL